MLNRCDIRKEAYYYICQRLSKLLALSSAANDGSVISLEELRLLKEGMADPSPEMVALVKRLAGSLISDAEIDAHLVIPFRDDP